MGGPFLQFVGAVGRGDAETALSALVTGAVLLLLCFPVHELAHAMTADRLGDDTPRLLGRISLNPLRHLDPIGTLLFLFSGFGWAKPVPVNVSRLNGDRRVSFAIVALAGPVSNIALAILFGVVFRVVGGDIRLIDFALTSAVVLNVYLAFFNLIPVPPLDGSRVLAAVLPPSADGVLRQLEQFGFVILIAVIYLVPQVFNAVVALPATTLARALLGL